MSIPKAKLFLYKSKCRTDGQGRPLWVKCDNEAACLQMAKNGFEVKMIEFDGPIPRPKYQGNFEIEGVGFGARRRKKKQNKRQRKLARKEHLMQNQASDGIISIMRHGGSDKKQRQTRKRQRGGRR